LRGPYAFDQLTLSGGVYAGNVIGNTDASQLTTGTIHPDRVSSNGTYAHMTDVMVDTVIAATLASDVDGGDLTTGTVPDARIVGSYSFDSLSVGTANASWIVANIDASNVTSGIVPIDRLDFDPVPSLIPGRPDLRLGGASDPWHVAYVTDASVDDVDVRSSIVHQGIPMQLDLETTSVDMVASRPGLDLGSSARPWSNVYVSRADVYGNAYVSNLFGESAALDFKNATSNIVPRVDGLWMGQPTKPWSSVRSDAIRVTDLDASTVSSSLVPTSSSFSLGRVDQPWGNVYGANVYGNVDGSFVEDVWAYVDHTGTGSVEAESVGLPNEDRGVRFVDAESSGITLDDASISLDVEGVRTVRISSESTMTTTLIPSNVSSSAQTLGAVGSSWRDAYVSNALVTSSGRVSTTMQLDQPFSVDEVLAANVVSSGTMVASRLFGTIDASSFVGGYISDGRLQGEYAFGNVMVSNSLVVYGSLTNGHLIPSGPALDLGSSSMRFRDVYVSGSSLSLNGVTLSELDGNVVVSSNVEVSGSLSGPVFGTPISIDDVVITDESWTPIDDTAVNLSGGFCRVTGSGFGPGSIAQIDGTNASSTSFVSTTQLHVALPAKPSGTYDLTVVRADSASATFPTSITYSQGPTWVTASNLGNVESGQTFTIELHATSDSTVSYSNTTALPPETSLVGANLVVTNANPSTDTTYSFDVVAQDMEYQESVRTFLLQFLFLPTSIAEVKAAKGSTNGVYPIVINGAVQNAYFDLDGSITGDSSGWMLYQSFGTNTLADAAFGSNVTTTTRSTTGGWTVYSDNASDYADYIRSWHGASQASVGYMSRDLGMPGITKAAVKFRHGSGAYASSNARLYYNNAIVRTLVNQASAIHIGPIDPSGASPHIRIDETDYGIYELFWIFVQ